MKLRWDHPLWRSQAPVLARRLVQAYLLTSPCDLVAAPEVKKLIASGPPVIYTTWHCHLLSPLFTAHQFRGSQLPMVLMASPSRDGEFIAQVARGLGFIVLLGSRRKGGVQTQHLRQPPSMNARSRFRKCSFRESSLRQGRTNRNRWVGKRLGGVRY